MSPLDAREIILRGLRGVTSGKRNDVLKISIGRSGSQLPLDFCEIVDKMLHSGSCSAGDIIIHRGTAAFLL